MNTITKPKPLSREATNYLKDVFHCSSISAIKPMVMHTIMENAEMTGDVVDKEIVEAYFTANALQPMTSEQFYARKC